MFMYDFTKVKEKDIEIRRCYVDNGGTRVKINANKSVWEIIWADEQREKKTQKGVTAEDNVNNALKYLESIGFEGLRPCIEPGPTFTTIKRTRGRSADVKPEKKVISPRKKKLALA
jgi:hypothetical protein